MVPGRRAGLAEIELYFHRPDGRNSPPSGRHHPAIGPGDDNAVACASPAASHGRRERAGLPWERTLHSPRAVKSRSFMAAALVSSALLAGCSSAESPHADAGPTATPDALDAFVPDTPADRPELADGKALDAALDGTVADAGPPAKLTEFPVPGLSLIVQVLPGPDGNLWFSGYTGTNSTGLAAAAKLGRITPAGAVTFVDLPEPGGLVAAGGGYLWAGLGRQVFRVSVTGIAEPVFADQDGYPGPCTIGPRESLWCGEQNGSRIFRLPLTSPSAGSLDAAVMAPVQILPGYSNARGLTVGPDGNVWFAPEYSRAIASISPTGELKLHHLPPGRVAPFDAGGGGPDLVSDLVTGPDSNLWFTEDESNQIGRMSSTGDVREFPLPTANASPSGIIVGPDGHLWFIERAAGKLGRIGVDGAITELAMPSAATSVASGPDGNLWIGESSGKIARLVP
jgi:virginiamycin B lyase